MRFIVTGADHTTGGRTTIEVDAPSKAAAVRKAESAGMDVLHAEPAPDAVGGDEVRPHPHAHRPATGAPEDAGRPVLWLVLLAVGALLVAGVVIALLYRIGHAGNQ